MRLDPELAQHSAEPRAHAACPSWSRPASACSFPATLTAASFCPSPGSRAASSAASPMACIASARSRSTLQPAPEPGALRCAWVPPGDRPAHFHKRSCYNVATATWRTRLWQLRHFPAGNSIRTQAEPRRLPKKGPVFITDRGRPAHVFAVDRGIPRIEEQEEKSLPRLLRCPSGAKSI